MSAANNTPWMGVMVIMIIIAVHLLRQKNPYSELILILSIGILGGALDSIFVYFQWISYPSGHIHENLTAYWIIAMWMSFATTLNISMAWLKNKNILGFIFGFVGGPLTYYAGYNLGGINFVDFNSAMIALAFGWGVIIPPLLHLADKFKQNPLNFNLQSP
jgi:fluoride ion exporter CrcB/FEX